MDSKPAVSASADELLISVSPSPRGYACAVVFPRPSSGPLHSVRRAVCCFVGLLAVHDDWR